MSQQPMKRYELCDESPIGEPSPCSMRECPMGEWVRHTDVEAVEAENKQLKQSVEWKSFQMQCDETLKQMDRVTELEHALAAKEAFKEEVEVVAQVNGWPGYSQGGHPAKYLNDAVAEWQARGIELGGKP